ncbi:ubiquitin-conjugating enzyme E2 Z-like [Ptychodera flava]|uniref:ubiquitin-conjugating enzyme E2 Z-like n=1 Tax=Ptychodera flava TaxID=63121 RepID=UPI00396A4535
MAELETELELLRSLISCATTMYLQDADITRLASMDKLKSGRLVRETADTCLPYWDGMDFTEDVFISRYYRDFRSHQVRSVQGYQLRNFCAVPMFLTSSQQCICKVRDITRLASMAKLKSGRLVRETADTSLQYLDGMGFVSRYFRDFRDIMSIYNEPPLGMRVVPDKDDITKVHALITGPFDTPYEGGFSHFLIRFPPDYPIRPPRVKLITTGDGKVRFNPNLYRNGKVCLSILGTWSGPAWSPAQSLSSVLISIQSLMNEKPYHNEPGFEQERQSGDAQRYDDCIRHETIRVAVCEMLENISDKVPDELRDVMEKSFPEFYDYYTSTVNDRLYLSGQTMQVCIQYSLTYNFQDS